MPRRRRRNRGRNNNEDYYYDYEEQQQESVAAAAAQHHQYQPQQQQQNYSQGFYYQPPQHVSYPQHHVAPFPAANSVASRNVNSNSNDNINAALRRGFVETLTELVNNLRDLYTDQRASRGVALALQQRHQQEHHRHQQQQQHFTDSYRNGRHYQPNEYAYSYWENHHEDENEYDENYEEEYEEEEEEDEEEYSEGSSIAPFPLVDHNTARLRAEMGELAQRLQAAAGTLLSDVKDIMGHSYAVSSADTTDAERLTRLAKAVSRMPEKYRGSDKTALLLQTLATFYASVAGVERQLLLAANTSSDADLLRDNNNNNSDSNGDSNNCSAVGRCGCVHRVPGSVQEAMSDALAEIRSGKCAEVHVSWADRWVGGRLLAEAAKKFDSLGRALALALPRLELTTDEAQPQCPVCLETWGSAVRRVGSAPHGGRGAQNTGQFGQSGGSGFGRNSERSNRNPNNNNNNNNNSRNPHSRNGNQTNTVRIIRPFMLSCCHRVCRQCLWQMAKEDNSHVRCPVCRRRQKIAVARDADNDSSVAAASSSSSSVYDDYSWIR